MNERTKIETEITFLKKQCPKFSKDYEQYKSIGSRNLININQNKYKENHT